HADRPGVPVLPGDRRGFHRAGRGTARGGWRRPRRADARGGGARAAHPRPGPVAAPAGLVVAGPAALPAMGRAAADRPVLPWRRRGGAVPAAARAVAAAGGPAGWLVGVAAGRWDAGALREHRQPHRRRAAGSVAVPARRGRPRPRSGGPARHAWRAGNDPPRPACRRLAASWTAAAAGGRGCAGAAAGPCLRAMDALEQEPVDAVLRAVERRLGAAGAGHGACAGGPARLARVGPRFRRQCDRRLRGFGIGGLRAGRTRLVGAGLPRRLRRLDDATLRPVPAIAGVRAGLRRRLVGGGALDGQARLAPEDLSRGTSPGNARRAPATVRVPGHCRSSPPRVRTPRALPPAGRGGTAGRHARWAAGGSWTAWVRPAAHRPAAGRLQVRMPSTRPPRG